VLEALAGGIPVCCSDIEPLRTVAGGQAELFDPLDTASIGRAIDRAVRARAPSAVRLTSAREFAAQVVDALPS